jgi:hypothetical protein
MTFIILAIPLSLLCFYISFLTWRRNFRRQALILAFFGFLFLGLAAMAGVISSYGYFYWQSL